ncbi:fatty acyl-AMP ligase [Micromonospora sp. WMMD1155]|uniref:fatty acyl-AMP ligase n=1 Tax=Micromonospora sp. WMMD1155 TaxID=3016094 RepID=UPI00249AE8B2|nr:fatty acyl-AMP ligase [Micromonospora sp. WMMD1155]WFE54848.1 fatty acyl-AMP ligase [Micromonospora sp. WMMD1155]
MGVVVDSSNAVAALGTLVATVQARAQEQPDDSAYVFLRDGEVECDRLTFRQLHEAAALLAARLATDIPVGSPVVLLYEAGLQFHRALLGCMYAGLLAAPVKVPHSRVGWERVRAVASDAGSAVVLTTADVHAGLTERYGAEPGFDELVWIATDGLPQPAGTPQLPAVGPDDIALLQYTSGSTGTPKGVMVSHRNFRANAAEIEEVWPTDGGTVVSWLPSFHDMGLLFNFVMPISSGIPAVLMAPEAFIRRPARWLEAIEKFGGTHAAAPNFAYELCLLDAAKAEVDLSSWRVAVNGAEPVRWRTVTRFAEAFASRGFDPGTMSPAYGLAENTLKLTGSRPGEAPKALHLAGAELGVGRVTPCPPSDPGVVHLTSCGSPQGSSVILIVDPVTRRECPPATVGEIWVQSDCVARGYWRRPAESVETFRARLADAERGGEYLRTGDLGFLQDGELYVTGRWKDVIVRSGRNYYAQDLELAAESADAALRPSCAAAFSVDRQEYEELILVVEVDGRLLRRIPAAELTTRIASRVHDACGIQPDEVRLVRRGRIPKTSSGKVQRRRSRELYLTGALPSLPAP